MTGYFGRRRLEVSPQPSSGTCWRRTSWSGASPVTLFVPDSRCRLPAPPLARAQLPQQGMPVTSKAIAPYSPALARRSVAFLTTEGAPRELNATMPTSAGAQVVVGTTPLQPALVPSWHPRELQQAHTPLRSSTFEQELRNHPNKAWISWLLSGIDNRVSTGYNGPRFPHTARNLASALKHPDIIDAELSKEIAAGRILGPFSERPLTNLRRRCAEEEREMEGHHASVCT